MNIQINDEYMLGEALLIAGRIEPMIREFLFEDAFDHLVDNLEYAIDNADDSDHRGRMVASFRASLGRASLEVFESGKLTILEASKCTDKKHAGMVYEGAEFNLCWALSRSTKGQSKSEGETGSESEAVSFEASKDSAELKAAIESLRNLSPENQQKVIKLIATLEKVETTVEKAVA